jgi:polyphosphate kinase
MICYPRADTITTLIFSSFLPDFGLQHLKYKPLPPLHISLPTLHAVEDPFSVIREKDQLLHVPYQSFNAVVNFFERAAADPDVTHIKVVQYRVARKQPYPSVADGCR